MSEHNEELIAEAVEEIRNRFAGLTLDELRLVEDRLQSVISDRLLETGFALERQLAQLHALAAQKGIKLKSATTNKAAAPARFRNPEPPYQEWSGRGRRPAWILAYDRQFEDTAKTEAHCAIPLPGLEPVPVTAE